MSCEYCNGEKPFAEDEDNFITISRFNDLFLVFRAEQMHLWNVPINFCPMCGAKLKEVD